MGRIFGKNVHNTTVYGTETHCRHWISLNSFSEYSSEEWEEYYDEGSGQHFKNIDIPLLETFQEEANPLGDFFEKENLYKPYTTFSTFR